MIFMSPTEILLRVWLVRSSGSRPLRCQCDHCSTSLWSLTVSGPWTLCAEETRGPHIPASSIAPLYAAPKRGRRRPSHGRASHCLRGPLEEELPLPVVWSLGGCSSRSGIRHSAWKQRENNIANNKDSDWDKPESEYSASSASRCSSDSSANQAAGGQWKFCT